MWHGSVLIVTKPYSKTPELELKALESRTSNTTVENALRLPKKKLVTGLKLYADPDKTFWRFTLQIPMGDVEMRWQYTIHGVKYLTQVSREESRQFFVPASTESMRIMFHSCNGFSVGTDEDFWSGKFLSAIVLLLQVYLIISLNRTRFME